MFLLEQNTTKKEQINELLESEPELDTGENKKYKVKTIKNSIIYVNKAAGGKLSGLYYLIS